MDYTPLVTDLIAGSPKYATSQWSAGISRYPTTPGQHLVVLKSPNLFALSKVQQLQVLGFVRQFAKEVKDKVGVQRCGLAYDGHQCLHLIPMHGLDNDWKPILAPETELEETYPGYLVTKSGLPMETDKLEEIQRKLTSISGWTDPDHTFHGDEEDDNLFARLTRGQIPQWRVWESQYHLAFLTPFPNTPGISVLIPRRHLSSDILGLPEEDYDDLMKAVAEVVPVLQAGLSVERVGMFFEGFEIDYAHVKLLPVLGNRAPEGPSPEYHETYPGYLTTRLGPEESDASKLEKYR